MSYASEQGILNYKYNNEILKEQNLELERQFIIANGANAKFGKDGDSFFYIVGSLPEPDCIVGFGDTPMEALNEFCKSYEGK
jgi:hypothetical protein